MQISAREFLANGRLGEQTLLGSTPSEIKALFGDPDDVGGTSRKYRPPSIYVYGSVELFFSHTAPYRCVTIYWELDSGALRLSDADQVNNCGIVPNVIRQEVERLLSAWKLSFQLEEATASSNTLIIVESGVALTFDGENRLHSVAATSNVLPKQVSVIR